MHFKHHLKQLKEALVTNPFVSHEAITLLESLEERHNSIAHELVLLGHNFSIVSASHSKETHVESA